MLLLILLCSSGFSLFSASAQSEETCAGLEKLTQNVNPKLLSKCKFDEECTFLSCETEGALASHFNSITFTIEPCRSKPGIKIGLVQKSGRPLPLQLIVTPSIITLDAVAINVSINSTTTSVKFSVDVSIHSEDIGYLIKLTCLPIDQTRCTSEPDGGVLPGVITPEEPTEKVIGGKATTLGKIVDKATTIPGIEIARNGRLCAGLEQLSRNANPSLLSKCTRDKSCSRVTCQTKGALSNQIDTVVFTPEICKPPGGVRFEFLNSGDSLFSRLITTSMLINQTIGPATIEAFVFVNAVGSAIGMSVNPITIIDRSGESGPVTVTDVGLNFTKVPFDNTYCNSGVTVGSLITAKGLSAATSFKLLLLLTLIALFINSSNTLLIC